jgi:prephenate dehydrogenase
MTIQFTILGLNQIGASMGLALGKLKDQVTRIGNDREPGLARQAEKMGAVDKLVVNLPSSVRNADVVILALPVDEIRDTIEVIAPDLKPGCVLVDTSPVQSAVAAWAKELLPDDDRYFVSMTPSLNPVYMLDIGAGPDQAHADLFNKGVMIISSLPGTDESALVLAANLTAALGATPLFSDPIEADSLLAYCHQLPQLMAAALINATTGQSGWREARKLAGPDFAIASQPLGQFDQIKHPGQSALLNPVPVARMLDLVIDELGQMRDAIRAQDVESLEERMGNARHARAEWLTERHRAEWETQSEKRPAMPTRGEMFGRLFGIRPRKDKEKDKRK